MRDEDAITQRMREIEQEIPGSKVYVGSLATSRREGNAEIMMQMIVDGRVYIGLGDDIGDASDDLLEDFREGRHA